MTVYLVMGSRGEWSDRVEYPVRVFTQRTSAEIFCAECETFLRLCGVTPDGERGRGYMCSYKFEDSKIDHSHDPELSIDYCGNRYWVVEVPEDGPMPNHDQKEAFESLKMDDE